MGLLLVAPVDVAALDPLVAAGVCLDHAGIDGKAFAADQPDLHARRHHALEHQPKRGALTEAAMAVDRERRMVRHCFFEAKPAEPPVGEIEPDLVAQSPLGTDRVAIARSATSGSSAPDRPTGGRSRCRMARAAYGPGRGRATHPACATDGSPEPGPRAGNGRTAAPDQPPTDPSSPHPIAIEPTATESRLKQARNTPFSTAPARSRRRSHCWPSRSLKEGARVPEAVSRPASPAVAGPAYAALGPVAVVRKEDLCPRP